LKGFGYVTFNTIEDAKNVFQQMNGASLGNGRMTRSVRLDYASSRPPQSGGGGFGGGFGGGRGGGGRGGGRGGFGSGANRTAPSAFAGTKMNFD
jgi:nucleolin